MAAKTLEDGDGGEQLRARVSVCVTKWETLFLRRSRKEPR